MEAQEILNKAYLGLMAQGKQSIRNGGSCAYHHNGLRCGVGLLIDDETAKTWDCRNDSTIGPIIDDGMAPDWMIPHKALLEGIQNAHDTLYVTPEQRNAATPEIFRDRLTKAFEGIANRFDLTMPEYTDGN